MVYTEIKEKGKKKYYYRVKSVREGSKVGKQRIYLGANLTKQEVLEKEEEADKTLLDIQEPKQEKQTKQEPIKQKQEKDEKGITVEKDEFSDWFTQLMIKADLADYTKVSGCMVFKPTAWKMWEKIVSLVNERLEKLEIKNIYFPLFIPEKLLKKEQEHVKGFSPEVAWVTAAGNSELVERLAIRPTSEAIMYDSFSKWIRSWRDLPLKLNQWSNVVRWEFRHPIPFFRTREFIFNEGHTVYATQKETEKEKDQIIGMYKDVCENYLALPGLIGKKTEKEKFAGAEYTISIEYYLPNGKAIQGPDFHHDGQNFAKAYNIEFLDEKGKKQHPWQNTWAISTRMLGVMFAIHSDSKGLIIPPKISPNQVVIVPILFEKAKEEIIKKAKELKGTLKEFNPILDDREEYKPGFKFNEWELKGIPIRIEIGPKDIKAKQIVLVRRDTNKKEAVEIKDLSKKIPKVLRDIQNNLFKKAQKTMQKNTIQAKNLNELIEGIKNKKLVKAEWCGDQECEEMIKYKTKGAKIIGITEEKPKTKCIHCNKKSTAAVYIAKSY